MIKSLCNQFIAFKSIGYFFILLCENNTFIDNDIERLQ